MTNESLTTDTLVEVSLSKISINPYQPRKEFSEKDLEELANSIKEVGIIHPPSVRPSSQRGCFELIAGERRLRAAQKAGLHKISVFVRQSSDLSSAQAALIENVQRQDLNPLEIAQALQKLIDSHQFTQQTLAQKIGKQRSTVANYIRLLSLPPSIQHSLKKSLITMGHAKAILSLKESSKQQLLHEIILRDHLAVRETEKKALQLAKKSKMGQIRYKTKDFHLEEIAEKLQSIIGSKVSITPTGKKRGRISIDYFGWEDFDRLLNLLNYRS